MSWITTLLRRPAIGWWDLVDILVVSVLIYELLKLIRGTRAVQMALGGAVLVALFYGSRWAHLETVNWLIRNLVGYLVFAVIVLFQSDIRRALAHLGRAPFFRYFAKPESAEESIEEDAGANLADPFDLDVFDFRGQPAAHCELIKRSREAFGLFCTRRCEPELFHLLLKLGTQFLLFHPDLLQPASCQVRAKIERR